MWVVVALSVLLQGLAVGLSLRLLRLTRHQAAWLLIALGVSLMAVRRGVHLQQMLAAGSPSALDPVSEIIALATSLLLCLGLALVKPLFLELRRHEQHLEHEVEQLRTVLDSLGEPAYVIDPTTHQILFANAPAESSLGPLQGRRCFEAIHGRRSPCEHCPCTHPKRADESTQEWEVSARGGERWFQMVNRPILWPDGRTVRLELSYDITDHKTHEQEVRRYSRRLESAYRSLQAKQKELEEFFYMVSHDLKAPIIAVAGFAQLLEDQARERLQAREKRHLERIVHNARQMEALLGDLLELSRVGRRDELRERVELNALVREVLADLEPAAAARGIRLGIAGRLPSVRGDRLRLGQLFTNLIDNAIKYMPAGRAGWVEVGWEPQRGRFYVRDNGAGLPAEEHERIFQMFYRARASREQASGSGVGLAIVRRIAETHGGRIWVDSAPGKGSTFYLSLADDQDLAREFAAEDPPDTTATAPSRDALPYA